MPAYALAFADCISSVIIGFVKAIAFSKLSLVHSPYIWKYYICINAFLACFLQVSKQALGAGFVACRKLTTTKLTYAATG